MRPLLLLVALVIGCGIGGCDRQVVPIADAPPPQARIADLPMQLQDHGGLMTGTKLSKAALTCDDRQVRTVAPDSGAQLLTFTTAGDCSACHTHLAGLDSLDKLGQLRIPHLYVSYATQAQRDDARRAYRRVIGDAICWDESGALWDEHGIAHTPVTVLVRAGTVLLVHDAPLTSDDSRRLLVDTIGTLLGAR